MIKFTIGLYKGSYSHTGILRIYSKKPPARALRAMLQKEIDSRIAAATDYSPSRDPFAEAALAELDGVITERVAPPYRDDVCYSSEPAIQDR